MKVMIKTKRSEVNEKSNITMKWGECVVLKAIERRGEGLWKEGVMEDLLFDLR